MITVTFTIPLPTQKDPFFLHRLLDCVTAPYLADNVNLYSLNDLLAVHRGTLSRRLVKLAKVLRAHVLACEVMLFSYEKNVDVCVYMSFDWGGCSCVWPRDTSAVCARLGV